MVVEQLAEGGTGVLGGFNRSSQRSIERGCDGREEKAAIGACGSAGDAVTGASVGGAAGASAAVLGGDRAGGVERGRWGGGGRVGPGRCPMVSGGWRDGDRHAPRAVGAGPVGRWARRKPAPARRRVGGGGGGGPGWGGGRRGHPGDSG